MSTLDGENLFGSGPHVISPGSWRRDVLRRSFSGVSGEMAIDQGKRSREIRQTGRLQAADAASLQTIISQIENHIDGDSYTLVDNHGTSFSYILMESFNITTGIRRGRGYWCDYEIIYRQLP